MPETLVKTLVPSVLPSLDMRFPDGSQDYRHPQNQHKLPSHLLGSSSTTAAYSVLLSILIYFILQYLNHMSLPLSELLWNAAVWITPSRIVSRLDSGFELAVEEDPGDIKMGFDSKTHASKSNAIRRILGLDGAGILTAVQRTRTLSNLGSVFKAKPNNSLPGLGNWDNSCYQNSILQGLAALESLPVFLDQVTHSDALQPTKTALRGVISRLNDPVNVGKTLWTPPELKSMSSWQQQDAQEYFSKISDELEKDITRDVNRRLDGAGLKVLARSALEATHTTTLERPSSTGTSRKDSEEGSKISQLPEELNSFIVRNPLEGLLAQRVGCQRCGYVEGLSLVPFNCLTVPLGKEWMYDIRTCLDDYTALEPITGVECAKCTLLHCKQNVVKILDSIRVPDQEKEEVHSFESPIHQQVSLHERLKLVEQALEEEDFSDHALKRCQIPAKNRVSTTKTRQAVVTRAPKSLAIHINRSNFDELTGVQSKNLATVRYPQQLDLSPWCLGQGPGSEDENDALESWSVDPSESMLSDDDLEDIDSGKPYVLRAVITHYGRHENGHYICYRKSPYSTQIDEKGIDELSESWWRLSDEEVSEVDEDIVLSQGGVFMLFYEQSGSPPTHVGRRSAAPSEHVMDVVEGYGEANQDNETAVTPNNVPIKAVFEGLPPESAGFALPTPPPSPGKIKPDVELSDQVEGSQILPSGAAVDITSTPTPTSFQALKPVEAPISIPSPHPSPSYQPKITSKPAASGSDEILAESFDATPPATALKECQPVSPVSMRTAGPRNGRGSVSRAGKAMGSVAGFVQAN